jgi:ParB family chromosome partitioning protein
MAIKRGLGKGLGALLGNGSQIAKGEENTANFMVDKKPIVASVGQKKKKRVQPKKPVSKGLETSKEVSEVKSHGGISEININDIDPNRDQPRKTFNGDKLEALAESLKDYGMVQPIIVKAENGRYRIIAGERRWRAAKLAGFKKVPVVIKDVSDSDVMEIALIENIQRQDLNPIEEAEAYERLIDEHKLTQDKLSKMVGKSRPAIANSLRILKADEEIKADLAAGVMTEGHARALMGIKSKDIRLKLIVRISNNDLSVREIERIAKKESEEQQKSLKSLDKSKNDSNEAQAFADIENKMRSYLGTNVTLQNKNRKGRHSGKIVVDYYSNEELEGILEKMGIKL